MRPFPEDFNQNKQHSIIILISSENVKDYLTRLVKDYNIYTRECPYCSHDRLIRWGYYFRQTLPLTGMIRIQRLRCKLCGRTTHVLPSFLLARRRHGVKVLENFIRTFVDNHCNWKQLLDISLDLSTAYRWLRIISQQALEVLPDIRKELLTLSPDHPLKQCQPEPVPSTQILLKRFLLLSRQLFKAAVRLAEPKDPLKEDLFCFLNLFLTQKTGKPLLTL